jgi:hypothetical protein
MERTVLVVYHARRLLLEPVRDWSGGWPWAAELAETTLAAHVTLAGSTSGIAHSMDRQTHWRFNMTANSCSTIQTIPHQTSTAKSEGHSIEPYLRKGNARVVVETSSPSDVSMPRLSVVTDGPMHELTCTLQNLSNAHSLLVPSFTHGYPVASPPAVIMQYYQHVGVPTVARSHTANRDSSPRYDD